MYMHVCMAYNGCVCRTVLGLGAPQARSPLGDRSRAASPPQARHKPTSAPVFTNLTCQCTLALENTFNEYEKPKKLTSSPGEVVVVRVGSHASKYEL